MPLWLLIGLIGLGTYFVAQNAATNAVATTPQLPPPKTYTVGTNGADWYADLGSSSSLATDMSSDMAASSSSATANISTTVGGQIPAGTVLTPLDVTEITVQPSSSTQQSQQSGTMAIISVIKVYWNSQYVWVNKNEVF
jgi:hypothetical protein